MEPDRYCEALAAPPGASRYYSLLFADAEDRRLVCAVDALRLELVGLTRASDAATARMRLGWWVEEAGAMLARNPRHPATTALAAVAADRLLPATLVQEMLATVETLVEAGHAGDVGATTAFCAGTGGVAGELLARLRGAPRPARLRAARELGTALALAELVRPSRGDGPAEPALVPRPADPTVIAALAVEARDRLARAGPALSATGDPRDADQLLLAALARAQLAALARAGHQVRSRRAGLTPLGKLWVVWRARGGVARALAAPRSA